MQHYDQIELVLTAPAPEGTVFKVPQPDCIKASLRQWLICTE